VPARRFHYPLQVPFGRNIGRRHKSAAATFANGFGSDLEFGFGPRADQYRMPDACQRQGDRPANASSCAGYDRQARHRCVSMFEPSASNSLPPKFTWRLPLYSIDRLSSLV
jgi:hypothetical protein